MRRYVSSPTASSKKEWQEGYDNSDGMEEIQKDEPTFNGTRCYVLKEATEGWCSSPTLCGTAVTRPTQVKLSSFWLLVSQKHGLFVPATSQDCF